MRRVFKLSGSPLRNLSTSRTAAYGFTEQVISRRSVPFQPKQVTDHCKTIHLAQAQVAPANFIMKRFLTSTSASEQPTKKPRISPERTRSVSPPTSRSKANSTPERPISPPAAFLPYPHGTIKRTPLQSYHASGDDISIEEILQRDQLNLAVLSSWQVDWDWLFSKIDLPRTKLVMIWHSKDPTDAASTTPNSSARLCIPNVPKSYGVMHSKLMLLFYENYMRIVVPSANLVPFDWGEGAGVIENSVFILDVAKLPANRHGEANDTLTPFADQLLRFLSSQDVDKSATNDSQRILPALKRYDFSHTQHLRFVHTILGIHKGSDASSTGLPLLSRSVRELDFACPDDEMPDVHYAVSSLGMASRAKLEQIHAATAGKSLKTQGMSAVKTDDAKTTGRFRALFPTERAIADSFGGRQSAGTIFCSGITADSFPRDLLFQNVSKRSDILSHAKVMHATSSKGEWVYVGSHNLSAAAWGEVDHDAKGQLKVKAKNWECGVVMAVKRADNEDDGGDGHRKIPDGLEVCIPFKMPAQPYQNGHRPWVIQPAYSG